MKQLIINSFDVFDTLLTRAVAPPDHLFLLLGRRLLLRGEIDCSAEVFARQRIYAEERANAIQGCHPTLLDIYRELMLTLHCSLEDSSRFVDFELNMERCLSRKVPQADKLVTEARERSGQVVFITDTNMSSDFIRELLISHDLYRSQDRIYASCECRVDKARGLLYQHVLRDLAIPARSLRHRGNDAVSDLRNGRLSGVKVRHLPGANLTRYEQSFAAEAYATAGLGSLIAGASRLARLRAGGESSRDLATVSAGVIAPCLLTWVIWMMSEARREGCGRLYFLSRDGQVLLDIARRLETVLHTGLDLRYLYASRATWQVSSPTHTAFRDLLRQRSCRLIDVAEYLGTDIHILTQKLGWENRRDFRSGRNLTEEERRQIASRGEDPTFRNWAETRSAEVRTLLQEYLAQEGWADGIPFGLIDVGWRASTAGVLNGVLNGTPLHEPHRYFFFGLSDDAHEVAGPDKLKKLRAWQFDDAQGLGYLPYMPNTTSLVEMFCAGDHGAISGFKRDHDRIVPILRTPSSPMEDWGLATVRQVITTFVDEIVHTAHSARDLFAFEADLRRPVQDTMELFWSEPTSREVHDWGNFPVETTLNNTLVLPLAEGIGLRQIWDSVRRKEFSFRAGHGWPQGTAVKSSWPFRTVFLAAWRFRKELPLIRRRFQWVKARFGHR